MNPNKNRFAWGVIVADWKPGNPTPAQLKQIGEWCHGSGTHESMTGYSLYKTKDEAVFSAKTWSKYDWAYAAKKYPLHRKP